MVCLVHTITQKIILFIIRCGTLLERVSVLTESACCQIQGHTVGGNFAGRAGDLVDNYCPEKLMKSKQLIS